MRGTQTCTLKCIRTHQVAKAKELSGHRSWELGREGGAQGIKFQAAIPQAALKLAEELSQEGVTRREGAGPGPSWAPDVQNRPSNKEDAVKREGSQDHVPFKESATELSGPVLPRAHADPPDHC